MKKPKEMILVSLKDGKKIKLESPASSNQTKQDVLSLTDDSDIIFDLDSCNSNMSSVDDEPDSDSEKQFNLDSSSSAETTVKNKKKRQRLTHLTPEEKIMRRKLKNRVAAQSARDRKKVRMDQLEEAVKVLKEQNEKLKNENSILKDKTKVLLDENRKLLEFKKQHLQVVEVKQVLDESLNKPLKRKLAEAEYYAGVGESAVFPDVSQQKKQLQPLIFQRLICVLIAYTMNLIQKNKSTSLKSQQFSSPRQQQEEHYSNLRTIKLKAALVKLIKVLKLIRNRQQSSQPRIQQQQQQLIPLVKRINIMATNSNNNSQSNATKLKLIILLSLLMKASKLKNN